MSRVLGGVSPNTHSAESIETDRALKGTFRRRWSCLLLLQSRETASPPLPLERCISVMTPLCPGTGLPLNWITYASERGNQFAQCYLGKLLLKGADGIPQDTNAALRWLRASVEQGNVHAEYALAMAYLKGESVPKDSLKAMELLKRASSGNISSHNISWASCCSRARMFPRM